MERNMARRVGSVTFMALAGAITLGVSACGSSGSEGASGGSVRIVQIAPLSGALAASGAATVQGAKAAVAEINSRGGVLGRTLELDVQNDQGDTSKAVSLLNGAVGGGDKPVAALAGTSTNEAAALMPTLTQNKIPSLQGAAALSLYDPGKYPYNFGTSATQPLGNGASVEMNALGDYLKQQGASNVGILYENSDIDVAKAKDLQTVLKSLGIQFATAQFSSTALDVTPQLQQLKAAGVDHLAFSAFGTPVGYVLSGRAKLGWTIPTVGDDVVGSVDLTTLASAAELSGVSVLVHSVQVIGSPVQTRPAFQPFYDAVKAQGVINTSINAYANAYDAIQLFSLAATQAKSFDGDAVKYALEHLNVTGNAPYVTYADMAYTPARHVVAADTNAFIVIPAQPQTGGLYKGTPQ